MFPRSRHIWPPVVAPASGSGDGFPSPLVSKYDEHEEQSECRGRHDEEVDRRETAHMVIEKRPPAPRRRLRMARRVFRYGCLRDFEVGLQQLSVNMRRAPRRVLAGHSSDKVADLLRQGRSPRFSSSRLPGPEEPEALSVPTDGRSGFPASGQPPAGGGIRRWAEFPRFVRRME